MSGAALRRDYERVETAIRFLEANLTRQPPLEEVAHHVGLSKYHFQKLFQRWAGVSPKRFLQFLTVGYAKELLRSSEPVLSTAYKVGLSGGGRLHDLFIAVEAVTPGEYKEQGRGVEIRYGVHPCQFGNALIGATDRGICWLSFHTGKGVSAADLAATAAAEPEEKKSEGSVGRFGTQTVDDALADLSRLWSGARLVKSQRATAPHAQRVFRIFEEDVETLARSPIPLHLKGTNFQIKVWEALLKIPQGTVVTYGDVARSIGRPKASRAVGTAVGQNPVSLLIPCHRVIRSLGRTGGYRWGPVRKRAILGWEAARVAESDIYEHAG